MLEIKNIKKSFGQTHVLHDVSLSVNKGDVIAILGPSGSGKTSSLPEFLREGRWRNNDV